jgi:hypothetical protein
MLKYLENTAFDRSIFHVKHYYKLADNMFCENPSANYT